MQNRKLKTAAAIVALVALLIAGTFAWLDASQSMVNEFQDTPTPGGTTHDDFDSPNKDVYVENWGDSDLFVRIRLDEYMELGSGAGVKANDLSGASNNAVSLIQGASIDDMKTWAPHIPSGTADICAEDFHKYWDWQMGGSKYYMPADPVARANAGYVDQNTTVYSGTEAGVKETPVATVLTLAEWQQNYGGASGPYWVIDIDGWAYWAQAVKPGEATGLLLDAVNLINTPDEAYYYAINVVVQMATKDGKETYRDFGTPTGASIDTRMTDEGKGILDQAAYGSVTQTPETNNPVAAEIANKSIGDTVQIDNRDWYIVKKTQVNGENVAMLVAKSSFGVSIFGPKDTPSYEGSPLQAAMTGYYSNMVDIKKIAVVPNLGNLLSATAETTPTARMAESDTKDIFFALSKADAEYVKNLDKSVTLKNICYKSRWWLRSPLTSEGGTYYLVDNDAGVISTAQSPVSWNVVPGVWVKY